MTEVRDRRRALEAKHLNGIDFVEVLDAAQTRLRVHFITAETMTISGAAITGGDTVRNIRIVARGTGPTIGGRPTLDIQVAVPGDFSTYRLELTGSPLDLYFRSATFSFKAGCPSTLDCEKPAPSCPPPAGGAPVIDYQAKDFESFCRALSDFAALRYPDWHERCEADFGVMFMEALASIADDLSYQQDRVAAEAWLDTATQRRSLVRIARMVDYEPRPAVSARVTLQFQVDAAGTIPHGVVVGSRAPDGSMIEFETGPGLAIERRADPPPPAAPAVDPAWNSMTPYWLDDAELCLARGATGMWVERPAALPVKGQRLLVETAAASPADAPVCQIVTLLEPPREEIDPLFPASGGQPRRIIWLEWGAADTLVVDRDLTRTVVRGNLVDATHGRRRTERFLTSGAWADVVGGVPYATVRIGANRSLQFLQSLGEAPLAWLISDTPVDPENPWQPEIDLREVNGGARWSWLRRLFEGNRFDPVFTLDPVRYSVIDGRSRITDYDGDGGSTVRFGDGDCGRVPDDETVFEVVYRVGGGARGNVAAGSLTRVDPVARAAYGIASVYNPMAARGGRDEEPEAQIRELAPQRFRARPLRAVRAEDYERAAMEKRDEVQRAGTRFRYTGSWVSVFTSVDPRGAGALSAPLLLELARHLDRRRLAGYESFVLPPRYAGLDLEVTVCARPDAFRGDVEQGILDALSSARRGDGRPGFFHPDRFTFGQPLERSQLEADIHDVPGVDGVIAIRYRRRGYTLGHVDLGDAVAVGRDEVICVDNDPDRPGRGSVRVVVRGGK